MAKTERLPGGGGSKTRLDFAAGKWGKEVQVEGPVSAKAWRHESEYLSRNGRGLGQDEKIGGAFWEGALNARPRGQTVSGEASNGESLEFLKQGGE